MNLAEARSLLAVTARDDAKAVRRAYLRKVKQHKPERDPDGFQRVREAYEVARLHARLPPEDTAPEPTADPTPAPTETAAEGSCDGSVREGDAPGDEPREDTPSDAEQAGPEEEDAEDAEARWRRWDAVLDALDQELVEADADTRVARLSEAFDADPASPELADWLFRELAALDRLDEAEALLPRMDPGTRRHLREELARLRNPTPAMRLGRELQDAPKDERVARLEAALAEDPRSDELREWLFHELLDADRGADAARLVEDASAELRPRLAQRLAARAPGHVSNRSLEGLRETAPYAAAKVLAHRGATAEAVALAQELIDRLPDEPHAYPGAALGLIVELAWEGAAEEAGALIVRLDDTLKRAGLARNLGQHDAVRLLFLGELLPLWSHIPEDADGILLRMAAEGAFDELTRPLARWASLHRADANALLALLRSRAPTLASMVQDTLRDPAAMSHPKLAGGVAPGWWLAFAAFALLSALGRIGCDGLTPSRPPRPAAPTPFVQPAYERPATSRGASWTASACGLSARECAAAERLEEAVAAGDCLGARVEAPPTQRLLARLEAEGTPVAARAADHVRDMLASLEAMCPTSEPGGPSP